MLIYDTSDSFNQITKTLIMVKKRIQAQKRLTCDLGSKVFLADDSCRDSNFFIKVDFLVLNINRRGSLNSIQITNELQENGREERAGHCNRQECH